MMWTLLLASLMMTASGGGGADTDDDDARGRKARAVATRGTVTGLVVYPIKSCAGVRLQIARTSVLGFEFDRRWVLVDAASGTFVTQRDTPQMALLRVEICAVDGRTYASGGHLLVHVPGRDGDAAIRVPFRSVADATSAAAAKRVKVDVWGSDVYGLDEGDAVASAISAWLDRPVRLLVKDPTTVRPLVRRHTPPRQLLDHEAQTAFADGFPYLVLTEASVDSLNSRLDDNTPLAKRQKSATPVAATANFRPNMIIGSASGDGKDVVALEPHAEDRWKSVRVGTTTFFMSSRCTRCTMPNVNFDTGVMDTTSLISKELMRYRRVDPGKTNEACFGMNAVAGAAGVDIRVGDPVEVLEFSDEHDTKRGVWQPEP